MRNDKDALILGLRALSRFDDLGEDFVQGEGDFPVGIMGFHFSEVGVVADVVANTVFCRVFVAHGLAGEPFDDLEGFEDGAAILLAAADVVDFAAAGSVREG